MRGEGGILNVGTEENHQTVLGGMQRLWRSMWPRDPAVRIRIPADETVINSIIRDGRLKSQHESGESGGYFNPDTRESHETEMFGVEGSRPIYGYIAGKGMARLGDVDELANYGSIALELRPSALDRTTVVMGDSLNTSTAPVRARDVGTASPERLLAATEDSIRNGAQAYVAHRNYGVGDVLQEGPTWVQYMEAQVHGGVSLKDVARVIVPSDQSHLVPVLQKAMPDAKIDVVSMYAEFTVNLRSIVAACYSAACRPPRSGGTGGSSSRGSAGAPAGAAKKPRAKKGALPEGMGTSQHRKTALTAAVQAAIDAEPSLAGPRGKAALDAVEKAAMDEWREKVLQGLVDGTFKATAGGVYGEHMIKLQGIVKKFAADPTAKALNKDEQDVKDGLNRMLNDPSKDQFHIGAEDGSEFPYTFVLLPRIHRASKSTIRQEASKWATPEAEQAVRRVGEVARKELEQRRLQKVEEVLKTATVADVRQAVDKLADPFQQDGFAFVVANLTFSAGVRPGVVPYGPDGVRMSIGLIDGRRQLTDHRATPEMKEAFLAAEDAVIASRMMHTDPGVNYTLIQQRARAEAFAEIMQEIRPVGGTLSGLPNSLTPRKGYDLSIREAMLRGTSVVPTDWIETSNGISTMKYGNTSGRAYYSHYDDKLTVNNQSGVATHEFMHRVEKVVPGVGELERIFLERRTTGEVAQPLRDLVPGSRYARDEVAKPDKFPDPYVGKIYGTQNSYEIMSMGVQSLYNGSTIDDDYANFLLGVLAVA